MKHVRSSWSLLFVALSPWAMAEVTTSPAPAFQDTCKAEILDAQKKAVDAKLSTDKRLLTLETVTKELSALYRLRDFPKDMPRPYILNRLKVKNKIVSDHVSRGGAPFRARAQFNLAMANLEDSRKNIKASLVYFDKARKLLPLDVEVAFKAADIWILTQIAQQNNRGLKNNKKDPAWLRLEKDFLQRFGEIEKNPAATLEHKSRAQTAIGRFYQGADDAQKAKVAYEKALEYDAKNSRAREFLQSLGL